MNLTNKKVLITGASDGIGKCIALSLGAQNPSLILLGRNQERLNKVKQECEQAGATEVFTYAFDLGDRSSKTDHLEQIRQDHPDLAVIINNAGAWLKPGQVDDFDHDQIRDNIEINLTSTIEVTNTLLPVLRNQEAAAIINISSAAGATAPQDITIYSAAKHGVRGFTQALYNDLGDTNIRVAGIYQGGTKTGLFKKGDNADRDTSEYTDPGDLADIITFMLTRPDRCWIKEIHVNYK